MRPVCARCSVAMVPKKNDVAAVEMLRTRRYVLWSADLYECPDCGCQIVTGFGAKPVSMEHEPGFVARCDDGGLPVIEWWHSLREKDGAA